MNNALLMDLYELTMAQSYLVYKKEARATFDLFVRKLPRNRAYLVFCGLDDILHYIRTLRFNKDDLAYLKSTKLLSSDFLGYLKQFRFTGDIWGMREGQVFFANEPVLRVTAPIIEAQIIESFLLNTVNLQTMIASKASRVVSAAGKRNVYDFSLRRTHGQDAGVKVARSSYIAGFSGTSCVLAGKLYGLPIVGTMAHSFVMSFKQEIDSFMAYARVFPERTILLVDTYETQKGIANAIAVGLYLKDRGYQLQGIRLDSPDIASLSKMARRSLDKAGLKKVKIFASGNLDEFKIKNLLDQKACVDSFGVGTHMGVSIDAPSLDVIYKISEVTHDSREFLPTMKLSKGKVTYPGRKQAYRVVNAKGKYVKDILGLENERIKADKLLIKVVDGGRIIYKTPALDKIRDYVATCLLKIPPELKQAATQYSYPVVVSDGLKKLRSALERQIQKRQCVG
ncbi:MAG: nicotinate phosphoribosyltransferase [Candidatus Omnitrophota bacterium]